MKTWIKAKLEYVLDQSTGKKSLSPFIVFDENGPWLINPKAFKKQGQNITGLYLPTKYTAEAKMQERAILIFRRKEGKPLRFPVAIYQNDSGPLEDVLDEVLKSTLIFDTEIFFNYESEALPMFLNNRGLGTSLYKLGKNELPGIKFTQATIAKLRAIHAPIKYNKHTPKHLNEAIDTVFHSESGPNSLAKAYQMCLLMNEDMNKKTRTVTKNCCVMTGDSLVQGRVAYYPDGIVAWPIKG